MVYIVAVLVCFCRELGYTYTLQTSPNLRLPSTWGKLSQLLFFLYDGFREGSPRLTGSLPASWGTLANLMDFGVGSAKSLSGPLPDAWNGMLHLQGLQLWRSNISGKLLGSWSNMTHNVAVKQQPTDWGVASFLGGHDHFQVSCFVEQQPQWKSANGVGQHDSALSGGHKLQQPVRVSAGVLGWIESSEVCGCRGYS